MRHKRSLNEAPKLEESAARWNIHAQRKKIVEKIEKNYKMMLTTEI